MSEYRIYGENEDGEWTDTLVNDGYLLNFDIPEGSNAWIHLRDRDDAGNYIKDNNLFWIHGEFNEETGQTEFKLYLRNQTFDFENPADGDGNNVYELQVEIRTQPMGGGEQTTTSMEVLVVVEDGPDPELQWPNWMTNYDENGNPTDTFGFGQ